MLRAREERLFYTTSESTFTVKMVDLVGGGLPVDLAPELAYADGVPRTTLVESADGRAIFFLGQERVVEPFDLPQKIYRVGIADGVPTPPVAMSDEAGECSSLYFFPAPDGGALAYVEQGVVRISMYGDGEPAWYELTTFHSLSFGLPTFLPLP